MRSLWRMAGLKQASDSEKKNITIARKSIHLFRDIKKGEAIKIDDLIIKRPGDGLSPMLINEFVGCVAKLDLIEDTKLELKNIEWK